MHLQMRETGQSFARGSNLSGRQQYPTDAELEDFENNGGNRMVVLQPSVSSY